MASCKGCIHFDVCMDYTSLKDSDFAQNFNETDILCDHFKRAADVVEVKHADWEIVKGSNGREKMVCTACRHQQDLHSTFTYCPNCGAIIHGRILRREK